MTKETQPRRPRRTPINGTRQVLTVRERDKDPEFVYRFVNDTGDRIEQFKEMGYEPVTDSNVQVGDKRVATVRAEGSVVTASVGGGVKAVLMKQKKEWYNEDQAAKQAQVDELEGSIKSTALEGSYGKISVEKGR